MAPALLDDDRHPAAEFLVTLLDDARLAVEPRVEAAADVHERHAGPGQDVQVVERLLLRHEAAQGRVLGVDARDLVRVLDRPGVGLAGRVPAPPAPASSTSRDRPAACRRRSTAAHRAGLRDERGDDDVEALGQQGQIDRRVAADRVGPEHPGLARGGGLRHDHRHPARPRAVGPGVVAVVALGEPRARGRWRRSSRSSSR